MTDSAQVAVAQAETPARRPLVLTVTCVIALVVAVVNLAGLPFTYRAVIDTYGLGYLVSALVLAGLRVGGIVGVWRLRRWGLYLYGGQLAAAFVVPLLFAAAIPLSRTLAGSIFPALFVASALWYWKRLG
jgi:hypothetical protein